VLSSANYTGEDGPGPTPIDSRAANYDGPLVMGLELRTATAARPEHSGTEPFYFRSGSHQLFGWLHQPTWQNRADLGLVLCAPFGYEAICAHRTLRTIAEQAAILGMAAIRFDYRGTGDSQDIDAEADQLAAWIGDVQAAAEQLRARTGVRRVALVGIRMGALLAALAAKSSAADAVILIAPVVSGRRYLSEIRTTQLAGAIGRDAVAAPIPANGASKLNPGQLEVSGFTLSAATTAALASCDLASLPEPPAGRALIIDNERLPTSRNWAESLMKRSEAVQYLALPGVVEMIMTAPQFASVPKAILKHSFDWLLELPHGPGVADSPPASFQGGDQLLLIEPSPGVDAGAARQLQERPVIGQGNVGRECRWGVCLPSIFGGASRPVLGNSAAGLHAARSRREVEVIGLDGAGLDGGPVEEKHIPKPGVVDNAGAIHHLQSVEVGLAQKAPGQPGQFDAIHARVDRLVRKVHDPQRDAPAPRLAPASGVNGPLGVRSDLREAQRFGRRSDC